MKKKDVLTVVAWMIGFPIFCIGIASVLMPQRNAIDDWWLYGVVMGFAFGVKWVVVMNRQKAQQEAENQELPPPVVNSTAEKI